MSSDSPIEQNAQTLREVLPTVSPFEKEQLLRDLKAKVELVKGYKQQGTFQLVRIAFASFF